VYQTVGFDYPTAVHLTQVILQTLTFRLLLLQFLLLLIFLLLCEKLIKKGQGLEVIVLFLDRSPVFATIVGKLTHP
jgi:hypothetical protein